MPLTDTAAKHAKPKSKQYRLTDGAGMYLLIKPSGKKYWRLDYSIHGNRKTFAIGIYPQVSLADAREQRMSAKKLIKNGIDPVLYRQEKKHIDTVSAGNTFGGIAEEWFFKQDQWTDGHKRTVRSRLNRDILPYIKKRPINELNAPEVLRIFRRIENRGAIETARRCKTICSQVFRYAIASGFCDQDPTVSLSGALKTHKSKRMAAITDPACAGELMRAVSGYQGDIITRCALQLSALTFVRPGELRHAEWSEINWIKQEWLIPAEKMKMRRDHTVPLSDQGILVLQEIHPLTGDGMYVFPSLRTGSRPMSNNTVLGALRRMGFTKDEMTPHGFRSMASTLLHENNWNHEIIELQLAHARKDQVSAAYDRSRRLPERKKMMQWWSDYLGELEHGEALGAANGSS